MQLVRGSRRSRGGKVSLSLLVAPVLALVLIVRRVEAAASFDDVRVAAEAGSRALSRDVEAMYQQNEPDVGEACAQTCTAYSSCGLYLPGLECDERYGSSDGCSCQGRAVSLSQSGVRTAAETDGPDSFASVCAFDGIDGIFRDVMELSDSDTTLPDRPDEGVGALRLAMFGANDGTYAQFPSSSWPGSRELSQDRDTCSPYEARGRPWYAASASPPKTLAIVLDASGSMTEEALEMARQVGTHLIDMLSFGDSAGLFVWEGDRVQEYHIRRATSLGKLQLRNLVRSVRLWEDFDDDGFIPVMEAATDALIAETDSCNKLMVVINDGQGEDPTEMVTSKIAEAGDDITIFSYTVGPRVFMTDLDVSKALGLACSTGGLYHHIDEWETPINVLKGLNAYLALGLWKGALGDLDGAERRDAWPVSWTEPYFGVTLAEPLATAGAPVFDQRLNPPKLMGVVAIDVQLCDVLSSGEAASQVMFDALERQALECVKIDVSDCELQALRMRTSTESYCGTPFVQDRGGRASAGNECIYCNNGDGELASMAFDGSIATKWLSMDSETFIQYTFNEPVELVAYSLTTANDNPGRDPRDWVVYKWEESTDPEADVAGNWVEVDARTDVAFERRHQLLHFKFSAPVSTDRIRIEITRNWGNTFLQVAEISFHTEEDEHEATECATREGVDIFAEAVQNPFFCRDVSDDRWEAAKPSNPDELPDDQFRDGVHISTNQWDRTLGSTCGSLCSLVDEACPQNCIGAGGANQDCTCDLRTKQCVCACSKDYRDPDDGLGDGPLECESGAQQLRAAGVVAVAAVAALVLAATTAIM